MSFLPRGSGIFISRHREPLLRPGPSTRYPPSRPARAGESEARFVLRRVKRFIVVRPSSPGSETLKLCTRVGIVLSPVRGTGPLLLGKLGAASSCRTTAHVISVPDIHALSYETMLDRSKNEPPGFGRPASKCGYDPHRQRPVRLCQEECPWRMSRLHEDRLP